MIISFQVFGVAAPQGSKRAFHHAQSGKIIQIENSKKVKPWRQAVAVAASEARKGMTLDGPIRFTATFFFERPKKHYYPVNTKHNGELRPDAPKEVSKPPDLDKLLRSTWDALKESGAIHDDSQISRCSAGKVYSDDNWTGAYIEIEQIK